jgi:uncharacterized protein with NRDE domain
VLSPRDLESGGTWIGLNAQGLFAGITNRFGVLRAEGRRSRGLVVLDALAEPSAEAAARRLAEISPRDHNGFHLVVADRTAAFLLRGDGEHLTVSELPPGVHVVTERSFGAALSHREELLRARAAELAARGEPSRETLMALLRIHGSDPLEGTCVHAPALDYGTRSSTLLRLGHGPSEIDLRHAEGPPCTNGYADLSPLARELWVPT